MPRTAPNPFRGHRSSLEKPGRGHGVGRTPLSPLAGTAGTFSCRAAWQGPVLRGARCPAKTKPNNSLLARQHPLVQVPAQEGRGQLGTCPLHLIHPSPPGCCQQGLNTLGPKITRIKGSERRQAPRMQSVGLSALVFPYSRSWHGNMETGGAFRVAASGLRSLTQGACQHDSPPDVLI